MSVVNNAAADGQIPFVQELWRKGTHMGALVIPGAYYLLVLSRETMLAVMIPVTAAMILIDISRLRRWTFWNDFARLILGKLIRRHETAGDFTGATYTFLSVCCTVAMFDKAVAVAALSFVIVGDTFAALIGRKFGRHRFGRKSLEGSLGCLAGTLLVALLAPGLSLTVGLTGAVVATVVEALSNKIDDNISVPIISGLAMTLLMKVLAGL